MSLEKFETQDKAPFKGLEKPKKMRGMTSELYEIPENSDVVVRRSFLSDVNADHPTMQGKSLSELVLFWNQRSHEFQAMADKYKLRFAKTLYVIGEGPKSGKNPGKPCLMAVTEKINGQDVNKMKMPKPESIRTLFVSEIDDFFSAALNHFWDSFQNDELVWMDQNSNQLVFGTRKDETDPHLYIVDSDPNMHSWKQIAMMMKRSTEAACLVRLSEIGNDIDSMKYQFNLKDDDLKKTDDAMRRVIDEMKKRQAKKEDLDIPLAENQETQISNPNETRRSFRLQNATDRLEQGRFGKRMRHFIEWISSYDEIIGDDMSIFHDAGFAKKDMQWIAEIKKVSDNIGTPDMTAYDLLRIQGLIKRDKIAAQKRPAHENKEQIFSPLTLDAIDEFLDRIDLFQKSPIS